MLFSPQWKSKLLILHMKKHFFLPDKKNLQKKKSQEIFSFLLKFFSLCFIQTVLEKKFINSVSTLKKNIFPPEFLLFHSNMANEEKKKSVLHFIHEKGIFFSWIIYF